MYSSQYPSDLFARVERLQREMQQAFDTVSPSIRGSARRLPGTQCRQHAKLVEVYAFAPGIDPARNLEVRLERGVLTIEGERPPPTSAQDGKTAVHLNERFFDGRFSRVVSLPDDIDPAA